MWERMTDEIFIDTFSDFLDKPIVLIKLVKVVFTSVYTSLLEIRKSIVQTIAKTLNIPDKIQQEFTSQYLEGIFQDFSLTIFQFTDEYYDKVCKTIREFLDDEISLDDWLISEDLKNFLKIVHKLYLHMVLNNPEIILKFNNDEIEYKEFNKGSHHCLDGFPKDGVQCAVVIPSPIRDGRIYQGIKSSVVMINEKLTKTSKTEDGKVKAKEKLESNNTEIVSYKGKVETINNNKSEKRLIPNTEIHLQQKCSSLKTLRNVSISFKGMKSDTNRSNGNNEFKKTNLENIISNKFKEDNITQQTVRCNESSSCAFIREKSKILHKKHLHGQIAIKNAPIFLPHANTIKYISSVAPLIISEKQKNYLTMDDSEVKADTIPYNSKEVHDDRSKEKKTSKTSIQIKTNSCDVKVKELRRKLIQVKKKCDSKRNCKGESRHKIKNSRTAKRIGLINKENVSDRRNRRKTIAE